MINALSKIAMDTMVYTILQMPNTKYNEAKEFEFLFSEIGKFIQIYNGFVETEEAKYIKETIFNELSEGLYLSEGLDTFNEGLAIFFRDKIYDGKEDYTSDQLYNLILDSAELANLLTPNINEDGVAEISKNKDNLEVLLMN